MTTAEAMEKDVLLSLSQVHLLLNQLWILKSLILLVPGVERDSILD